MRMGFSRGSITLSLLILVLLVGVALGVVAYLFGYVVPPGYMGVRQVLIGPGQGFAKTAVRPGYYAAIPFRSRIHVLPRTVQIIPIEQGWNGGDPNAWLEVTSRDGAYVRIQAVVHARIYPAPSNDQNDTHGGPADLIERTGLSPKSWWGQVVSVASDKLNRNLSALRASEFYNPKSREQALADAEEETRIALKPYGIALETILLNRYTYIDAKIDEAIFRKNIQSQEEKFNEQSSKLAEAKAKLEQVSAEWDAKIESLKVEGENKVHVMRSGADLFEKQKRAEGDLLYAQIQAQVDKLKADAYAQSGANDLYVARELAPLLATLKGGVIRDQDPYDLEAWLRKLGIASK